MPSPESRAIRATFHKDADPPNIPPAIGRQEWDTAAALVPLPAEIKLTGVDVGGMAGEWIDSPEANPNRVLFFLHGGGYNAGSCVTHRELAAHVCLACHVRVFLISYRLAPEHPFPAAVEDAGAGYQWLLAQGIRPENIVIAGDSAGGGLAVATLLWLREHKLPLPAAGVFLSPWVDLTLSGPSMETHAAIDPLTSRKALQRAANWYAGDTAPNHPLLSPVYAELSGLPPLLIQVGSDEVLLSDATRLAEKAQAAGVETTLEVWDGMWHVWQSFATSLPEAREAIEQIGAFIKLHLISI